MQPRPWLWRPHRTWWPVIPRKVCCRAPPNWWRQLAPAHRASNLLLLGVRAILVWHGPHASPVGPQWPHHIPQLLHLVLTQGHVGALIGILCTYSPTLWAHSPCIHVRRTMLLQLLQSPLVHHCHTRDLLYPHPSYNRTHRPTPSSVW